MPTPELNPLPIRDFLENNADRISEAVRKAARLGAGGHEPVGVEAEILQEQASSAIVEALAGAIDATEYALHVGIAGDVTIVAEIVPEGPRTRGKVLLRAGRTLPVASLPVPSRREFSDQPHHRGQDAAITLEQEGLRRAIADSDGELRVRGVTPGDEYEIAHTPSGEIVLVPMSPAMTRTPLKTQGGQPAVSDQIWDELAAYVARWRSHIDEVVGRIVSDLDDEAIPVERELLLGKVENALGNALADALSRRHEAGLSYGIVFDIVIGIPRPFSEQSIMIWASRLACRGEWIPSFSDKAAPSKRRQRGRK